MAILSVEYTPKVGSEFDLGFIANLSPSLEKEENIAGWEAG
jgi:hypothetical protein